MGLNGKSDDGGGFLDSGAGLNAYEAANRLRWLRSGGREGLPMVLPGSVLNGGGVFWSRGYQGCPVCAGRATDPPAMYPFREVRNGVIREGWSCAHQNVPWDE